MLVETAGSFQALDEQRIDPCMDSGDSGEETGLEVSIEISRLHKIGVN